VSVPVLPQRPHRGTLLRFAILFLLAFFDFRFAIFTSFNLLGSYHFFVLFMATILCVSVLIIRAGFGS